MIGSIILKHIFFFSADLNEARVVDQNMARQLAASVGLEYAECSAKTGEGIEKIFEHMLGKAMLEEYKKKEQKPAPPPPPSPESQCCRII